MSENRVRVYVLRPKDRPILQLQWIDPDTGKRRTRTSGTDNPVKAEQARADLEYELNHNLLREPSKMPWMEFRRQYKHEHLANLREGTIKKAGYVFDAFEEFFG